RHTRSKRDWSSDVCSSDLCRGYCRSARTRPPGRSRTQQRTPAGSDTGSRTNTVRRFSIGSLVGHAASAARRLAKDRRSGAHEPAAKPIRQLKVEYDDNRTHILNVELKIGRAQV